jgi:hypothetical protein
VAAVLCEVDAEHVQADVSADSRRDAAAIKAPTNEWRRYRSPKNKSNGSEVAPAKGQKLNRVRRSSVPHGELVKVPHRTPLSISRAEGGGEGRGAMTSDPRQPDVTMPGCGWCKRPILPRRGGSPRRFCCAAHRIAFWSALRRWAERAVVAGALTVDHIRNCDPAACTLLPGAISPTAIPQAQKPTPAASAERLEEAAELLDDLLLGLFDLPGDAWPDLAVALPDELYDRIDQYIERCFQES